jgi:hypothetical protein
MEQTEYQKKQAAERVVREHAVQAIAAELHLRDGAWRWAPADGDSERDTIRHTSGAELFFRMDSYDVRGRIEIRGSFHIKQHGNLYEHIPYDDRQARLGITVARDRNAEAVAREIQRRLIPEYLRIYTVAVERKRKADYNRGVACSIAEQVAKLVGDDHFTQRNEHRNGEYVAYGSGITVKISTHSGGSIEYRCDTHEELLRAVKALVTPQE